MSRILITGGNGYIASSIVRYLPEYNFTCITREDCNLLKKKEVDKVFDKYYDLVIHTAITGGNRLEKEEDDVFSDNVLMFHNLLRNKKRFGRLINFGSGADQFKTPYGLSKLAIRNLIKDEKKCYNLRIFAVFDQYENDRRFIKSALTNYINRQPIEVHENKFMDFFYMPDLCEIIREYIEDDGPKEMDFSYKTHYTLAGIAEFINSLSEHKVEIKQTDTELSFYTGTPCPFSSPFGLHMGICETYLDLLINRTKNVV